MRTLNKISMLLVLAAFLVTSAAYADVDKDGDKDKKAKRAQIDRTAPKFAGVGECNTGSAFRDLDGNNIRARLYNTGGIFWKGSGNVYTVPIGGEANSIFASGIWVGGRDEAGELRFAGTTYGPYEYWPGPLDENGNAPMDCSAFDRIFKITRDDLDRYELEGQASADILDWPWELGAPVVDGDGNPNNYNLEGGDRPELIGEQTAWWVMNDVGNVKTASQTGPIGLEVQVTAFAFRTADALNNTTFYKYKLIHKGDQTLSDTWFGIWSDPDLGNAADDFVGSDTTLGLGFVYNGTDFDQGFDGYGDTPPALAYDFFQGPLVEDPNGGTWVDPDGTEHPGMRRLPMQRFVYYNNDSSVIGNPSLDTDEGYNYLRGIWRDGTRMTLGGNGYGGSTPTNYIFPGDPVSRSYWSEENTDGLGSRNTPADRRFLMSTGPFTLEPGDTQEIVYGIVWARSVNRLASVAQMRFDDILAQGAFNSNFSIPRAPDAPEVSVTELDGEVILEWSNLPTSNNFLNKYDVQSAFLVDQEPADGNTTYTFEGYRVWRYDNEFQGANEGTVIATYDIANQVTTVVDEGLDIETGAVVTRVVANGTDAGVQTYHSVPNLVNYQDYHFGVQAYAYNPNSAPKVYASPIVRVTATPRKLDGLQGGTVLQAETSADLLSVRQSGTGDPFGISAKVIDPASVTGDSYTVRVYDAVEVIGEEVTDGDETYRAIIIEGDTLRSMLTYDLTSSGGDELVNGADFIQENGRNVPFGSNILTADGLSFSIDGAPPGFKNFLVVANAAGPVIPPTGGSADFQNFPVPARPGSEQQVNADGRFTGAAWFIGPNETFGGHSFDDFLANVVDLSLAVPYDWEIRFPEGGSQAPMIYPGSLYGDTAPLVDVPFELWRTGIDTPDDPSDDVQYVPSIIDVDGGNGTVGDGIFNLLTDESIAGGVYGQAFGLDDADSGMSGGNNDPQTDAFEFIEPLDLTPGSAGYQDFIARFQADPAAARATLTSQPLPFSVMSLVVWNGGSTADAEYPLDMFPEPGTVFRMVTTKPLAAGDVFTIDAAGLAPVRNDQTTAQENIDQIGIVPNPYKGASAYEIDLTSDEVRFTNLPDRATIRVFNLAGTLIRTMNLGADNPKWDLTTDDGLPIASGMYLIHVEVPGVGEKVIKFGVVKKRVQLDLF